MEWRDLQATWDGDIASIRPLGDFVLVRPFPMEHGTGSLIINPNVHMTKDGRWRSNRLKGNQMGEVVAVGRGDKMPLQESRHAMNVQPGDVVIYPQVPSNEVSINGERMIFLHEEQHVLGVVENEKAT